MAEINIFDNAKPQVGEFFKFKNIGDSVQGTYVDVRDGVDSYNNPQKIYVIIDASGKVWNLGFRQSNGVIMERMAGIRYGQIVGFRFDEERDSKKSATNKAKIIRIYADPKFVDQKWLDERKSIESQFDSATPESFPVQSAPATGASVFSAPASAAPMNATAPAPKNEAVEAIRNLATTKGLVVAGTPEAEADKVIEAYAGLPLVEENLTKIIIKLTSFSK